MGGRRGEGESLQCAFVLLRVEDGLEGRGPRMERGGDDGVDVTEERGAGRWACFTFCVRSRSLFLVVSTDERVGGRNTATVLVL